MEINSLLIGKFEKFVDKIDSLLFFNVASLWTNSYKLPFLISFLVCLSLYFSLFLRFLNLRSIFTSLKYFFLSSEDAKNSSSVKSIMLAVIGSNIDIGSIFGVSYVVLVYGPGVIFWILIGGIVATGVNFFEIYCGHRFKVTDKDGNILNSGTTSYIRKAFELINFPFLGKIVAIIFSLSLVFATFFSAQMNQVVRTLHFFSGNFIPIERWIISLFLSILICFTISGGFQRIVGVSRRIVPLMSYVYIIVTFLVYFVNRANIGYVFSEISSNIFQTKSLVGGVVAMVLMGFQRSFFCTECGLGTIPLLHMESSNTDPIIEAKKSIATPILSTLILCFCSGMMVLITKSHLAGNDDFVTMTNALNTIGSKAHYVLLLVIPLFGFSTAIAWGYYGQTVWAYLFGKKKWIKYIYIVMFSISYFICGSVEDFSIVLRAADAVSLSIAIPNVISLFILSFFLYKDIKDDSRK